MCNALNHNPGCTCGFGGEGHLGGGPGFYRSSEIHKTNQFIANLPNYNSYVNPNASCPVCGSPVYFYQSPYGGRVFFDELGPPWPKHPCTDNGNEPIPSKKFTRTKPKWVSDGWRPLHNPRIKEYSEYKFRISGYVLNESDNKLIQHDIISSDLRSENHDLWFYRDIDECGFEIMTLSIKNNRKWKLTESSPFQVLQVGDVLKVKFSRINLGDKIQVYPVEKESILKCFIKRTDLREGTRRRLRERPKVGFTIKAKVISTFGQIFLKEVREEVSEIEDFQRKLAMLKEKFGK